MDNNTNGTGFLRVKVSTAREALPIEGALVRISAGTETENGALYSLRTNSSGYTDTVRLAAPPAYLSTSPGNTKPFSTYNIEIVKDGYNSVLNMNVPIFDGIVSLLPVSLVPFSEFQTEGLDIYNDTSSGGVYNGGNNE